MAAAAAALAARARKEKAKGEDKPKHVALNTKDDHGPPAANAGKDEAAVTAAQAQDDALIYVGWRKYQPQAKWLYSHIYVQVSVAGLIGLNFLCNIIQAQIDPDGTKHEAGFGVLEWFFNIAFLIELILNMYSSWLCDFWHSGWNIFDFNVVLIGWMFQLEVPLPGPMKLLRMMRAFRVFRLFKRVESLRKILNSLASAVPGVMNAFLIQLIVMCIYAIIAVDRFQDYGAGGTMTNEHGDIVPLTTSRDQDYGFEYFGDFGKSLFTMFQVLTGESWSEVVCRPLFHSNNPTTSMGAAFFFVSFVILNAVVLINVVVAVLLEKMVDEDPPAPEEEPGEVVEKKDPVQENLDTTVTEVAGLKNQMNNLIQTSMVLQQQLADVGGVKEQLAALLTHKGIKVEYKAPVGLEAAACVEDLNGENSSPQPPETPLRPNIEPIPLPVDLSATPASTGTHPLGVPSAA